jgi:hypothetical protein
MDKIKSIINELIIKDTSGNTLLTLNNIQSENIDIYKINNNITFLLKITEETIINDQ